MLAAAHLRSRVPAVSERDADARSRRWRGLRRDRLSAGGQVEEYPEPTEVSPLPCVPEASSLQARINTRLCHESPSCAVLVIALCAALGCGEIALDVPMIGQRSSWWCLVSLLLVATISAQAPRPTFDVTSVRRSKAEPNAPSPIHFLPGRFVARSLPLSFVIAFLYGDGGRLANRMIRGPGWVNTDAYDIEGSVEGDPPQETLRLMARALLEDRFQLRVRTETREGPVYELHVAPDGKLGEQLRPSTGRDCITNPVAAFTMQSPACGSSMDSRPNELVLKAYNVPMAQIAGLLGGLVDRPLINRTNLSGNYSFELRIPRQEELPVGFAGGIAGSPGGLTSLVQVSVREQLGLRISVATGPVDVLVIDSVERPTEN